MSNNIRSLHYCEGGGGACRNGYCYRYQTTVLVTTAVQDQGDFMTNFFHRCCPKVQREGFRRLLFASDQTIRCLMASAGWPGDNPGVSASFSKGQRSADDERICINVRVRTSACVRRCRASSVLDHESQEKECNHIIHGNMQKASNGRNRTWRWDEHPKQLRLKEKVHAIKRRTALLTLHIPGSPLMSEVWYLPTAEKELQATTCRRNHGNWWRNAEMHLGLAPLQNLLWLPNFFNPGGQWARECRRELWQAARKNQRRGDKTDLLLNFCFNKIHRRAQI